MRVLSPKFFGEGILHCELYDGSEESIAAIIKMFGGEKSSRAFKTQPHGYLAVDFAGRTIGFNVPPGWWVFEEGGICHPSDFVANEWREVVEDSL